MTHDATFQTWQSNLPSVSNASIIQLTIDDGEPGLKVGILAVSPCFRFPGSSRDLDVHMIG